MAYPNAASRPTPNPVTGELRIDPEVVLLAKKFNLSLEFNYGSDQTDNSVYGRGRTASVNGRVQSSTSTNIVTIVSGDFTPQQFTKSGSSGGITSYTPAANKGIITTLTYDGTEFTQQFPDGMQMVYQAQVGGGNPVTHELTKVKDASGNVQSYTYGTSPEAGLLKTIEVPGGRKATFIYAAGGSTSLLNAVQDWTGRRWTFQYDSDRYLTTYTTPMGCSTKYAYTYIAAKAVTVVNAIEDPRGYRTTYGYTSNAFGVFVASMTMDSAIYTYTYGTMIDPVSSFISPSGARTTFQYNDLTGLIEQILRPQGYTSSLTFSNKILVSEQTPPERSIALRMTQPSGR